MAMLEDILDDHLRRNAHHLDAELDLSTGELEAAVREVRHRVADRLLEMLTDAVVAARGGHALTDSEYEGVGGADPFDGEWAAEGGW